MPRCQIVSHVVDEAGNAITGAKVFVYNKGTTTAPTDVYGAETGGSAVTFALSNTQGEVTLWKDAWVDAVDLKTTDNDTTAVLTNHPDARLVFAPFTERVLVQPVSDTFVTGTAVPDHNASSTAHTGTFVLATAAGSTGAALAPVLVDTATTGLSANTPDNLRTGLSDAVYADGSGGYITDLTIAVTGTEGSAVLTSSEPTKVAGLGSSRFEAALNATDGSDDFFVTVLSHNGSNQITLRHPLKAAFAGTLSAKYNAPLGQHLTAGGTKAYARHVWEESRKFSSRGAIIAGTWDTQPPTHNVAWARNAALVAYGVVNSAAPLVQTNITVQGSGNIISTADTMPVRPLSTPAGMQIGTHLAGHGGTATLYARRKDSVLEFWTGTLREGTSLATARLRVIVTGDGRVIHDEVIDGFLTRIQVPLVGIDKVVIDVTNNDGSIYNLLLSQLTLREAGTPRSGAKKIVTLGDSWFTFYSGLFGRTLAAKTKATVVNPSVGGTTSEWALSWFDELVADERPDECWLHFFTNDNNQVAGTFVAPDGSTQPYWPSGLTADQTRARWRENMLILIQRCRALGIVPVVVLPGGTASAGQMQAHMRMAWALSVVPQADDYEASAAELADTTAHINTVGKAAGRVVTSAGDRLVAAGPLATDGWSPGASVARVDTTGSNSGRLQVVQLPLQAIRVVDHGSTASTARPVASTVYWVGSVRPRNWESPDLWYNTATGVLTAAPIPFPLSLTNLKAWYKADGVLWQESTRTNRATADLATVGSWDDASTNAKHAIMATTTKRPTLRTNVLNGRPIVRFNGAGHELAVGSLISSVVDNFTMVAIIQPSATTAGRNPFYIGTSASNGYGIANATTGTPKKGWLRGGAAWEASTTDADTALGLYVLVRDAGVTTLYVNNVALSPTWTGAPIAPTANTFISNGGVYPGDIAEVFFAETVLTSTQRNDLNTYSQDRWGTP